MGPGDAPLSSAEYQARIAWNKLLVDFGGLEAVQPRLARDEAATLLRELAAETVFQPEGPEASIQILGLLEAQGLAFDALWIAGLSAERWPPAPQPNALLPTYWQRERNLPRSSAAREMAYARALTERYLRAAPCVVLSHPTQRDQHDCGPSALIGDLPALAVHAPRRRRREAIHAAAPAPESTSSSHRCRGRRGASGGGAVREAERVPFARSASIA